MTPAPSLREHPLLHSLLHTGKRDVPATVALRNTAAIVLPLAIGSLSGHLLAGLGVSAGALNTLFADQPGPYRLRLRRMLLTALVAGIAAFAGSVLGQWPAAFFPAAAVWGFGAAMMVAIDAHATRVGLTSLILLVIMGAEPHAAREAWAAAMLIFAGGVLQTLFAIAAWPLQRYRPERFALAQAFRALAGFARTEVAHGGAAALPPSLNDLQVLLFGEGRARGRAVEAFRVLAELAERIRLEVFALAQQEALCGATGERDSMAASRTAAAEVLDTIAAALEQAAPPQADTALAAFERAAIPVESAVSPPETNLALAHLAALGGQLRAAVRNADTAGSRGELRAQRAEFRLPRMMQAGNSFATLRANLRLSSPACRHAIRCGVCVAIALALSHALPLSRGYWMPMTVAIVLKPDFGATWRYGLLRVAGTLGGLLLTTAVLHIGGVGNFWIALSLMAVLCFAFRELATVHYGIAVVCLTGTVVILLSFYGIPAAASVQARAVDTLLGSTLALLAYFAWPTWERGRERATLADLLDAYAAYLDATLHGDAQARHATRIEARAARSSAQASLDRLRAEPASRANLPRAEALVAQANRVVRAVMMLEAARSNAQPEPSPQLADFAHACDAALRESAGALREARAPHGEFPLRTLQRTLAASLPESDDAFAVSLSDASDRIVDAIDSLLHVLARERASPAMVATRTPLPPGEDGA
ncbi:MAG: FUSC family protein [Xanthomonadaceae bacterium]|nr:FUSC family protein [Xanthomonadaceae bacterium]MDE2496187.1 FUSC family protein [Xanthomonadaceae bacterium]